MASGDPPPMGSSPPAPAVAAGDPSDRSSLDSWALRRLAHLEEEVVSLRAENCKLKHDYAMSRAADASAGTGERQSPVAVVRRLRDIQQSMRSRPLLEDRQRPHLSRSPSPRQPQSARARLHRSSSPSGSQSTGLHQTPWRKYWPKTGHESARKGGHIWDAPPGRSPSRPSSPNVRGRARPNRHYWQSNVPDLATLDKAPQPRDRQPATQSISVSWSSETGRRQFTTSELIGPSDVVSMLSQPLLAAASRGDVVQVQGILEHALAAEHHEDGRLAVYELLAARDKESRMPLHCAARYGHAQACELLLDVRADVHAQEGHGATSLALACLHGHRAVVHCLLRRRARPERSDHRGRNAFHFACCHDPEIVCDLLQNFRGLPFLKDGDGRNALFFAMGNRSEESKMEILRLLLEEKCSAREADSFGCTALSYAEQAGEEKVVALLLRAVDLEMPLHLQASLPDRQPGPESGSGALGADGADVSDVQGWLTSAHDEAVQVTGRDAAGSAEPVALEEQGVDQVAATKTGVDATKPAGMPEQADHGLSSNWFALEEANQDILVFVAFVPGVQPVVLCMPHLMAAQYSLRDTAGLVGFCRDADVRLLRPQYLQELHEAGRAWPRRQEAEQEYTKDGKEALYTQEELQEKVCLGWERFTVFALSHVWESREHPDPARHQLRPQSCSMCKYHLVSLAEVVVAGVAGVTESLAWLGVLVEALRDFRDFLRKLAPVESERVHADWEAAVFIDYSSLYQFQRLPHQDDASFKKAMGNMHVVYSHDESFTLRIEGLTPGLHDPDRPKPELSHQKVSVFHVPRNAVVDVSLAELRDTNDKGKCPSCGDEGCAQLHRNGVEYQRRGWCSAEAQWSAARAEPWHSIPIPFREGAVGTAPMAPADFRAFAEKGHLRFTHRSDLEPVVQLQARVFEEKAAACTSLVLPHLPSDEVKTLCCALPYFPKLEKLNVNRSQALVRALPWPQMRELTLTTCQLGDAEAQ
ncbi:ANK1, partial [Symbiodinium natans]